MADGRLVTLALVLLLPPGPRDSSQTGGVVRQLIVALVRVSVRDDAPVRQRQGERSTGGAEESDPGFFTW